MDKTKSYTAIARKVDAIQYTGTDTNIEAIVKFAGDAFLSGLLRASETDWIVKKSDGEFEVLTDEEFMLNYRESTITAKKTR